MNRLHNCSVRNCKRLSCVLIIIHSKLLLICTSITKILWMFCCILIEIFWSTNLHHIIIICILSWEDIIHLSFTIFICRCTDFDNFWCSRFCNHLFPCRWICYRCAVIKLQWCINCVCFSFYNCLSSRNIYNISLSV